MTDNTQNTYTSYKSLIVYQKAKQLTVDIINYFSGVKIPKSIEFLINQLFRSISSIGANIAEGYGRHYKGSFKQFLGIARGSSFESDFWLEILIETKYFDINQIIKFQERNTELMKILTTLMKNVKAKQP
jgi:four helix bundle protein